jgi:hypothetical protein
VLGGRLARLAGALLVAVAAAGCASSRSPTTAPAHAAPAVSNSGAAPGEPIARIGFEPAEPVARIDAEPGGWAELVARAEPPSLRELCRREVPEHEAVLDATSRRLQQTFCSAGLWFDGLLGGPPDIASARGISGRIELSSIYTEFEGFDPKGRVRLRYDLPNLEHRVNLFLGRDDRDEFVADRTEGAALRSSVFGLDQEDDWLLGFGWSRPGPKRLFSVRVGGKIKTAPEVFVQARVRRDIFVSERSVWRLRETAFYENRDGFGLTTGADIEYIVDPDHLVRWSNVGTWSEGTQGVAWRTALISYRNLGRGRALAGEAFLRGATDSEVPLRELGARTILRWPIRRSRLFGELIVGYTWPRRYLDQPREGSSMIGFGVELLFGREPY